MIRSLEVSAPSSLLKNTSPWTPFAAARLPRAKSTPRITSLSEKSFCFIGIMADAAFRRIFLNPPMYRDWNGNGSMAEMDWLETPTSHVFKINVPGLGRDDIKVQLEEGNVLLMGGRAKEESNQEVIWHLAERGRGDFSRQIVLPENVKVEQIKAGMDDCCAQVCRGEDETKEHRHLQQALKMGFGCETLCSCNNN